MKQYLATKYTVDPTTGCWIWNGAPHRGYGMFKSQGVRIVAHRVVYVAYKGPIPDGLQIDHICRNRLCVNPDHLEPVTGAVNIQRGSCTKLQQGEVDLIRLLMKSGKFSQTMVAKMFRINQSQVSRVVSTFSWGVAS